MKKPGSRRILIVDDDQRNIFALKAVLTSKGFNCLVAQDAPESINILENDAGIDCILLDMMMPGTDGYETIKLIRIVEGYNMIPVVAVTAQALHGDRQKCLDAGADDYLSKPIDVDILLKKLSEHIKD